jgi:NAD(P)-dependent dehydrogenase (short-subunit alcohol dehydrogenase family)
MPETDAGACAGKAAIVTGAAGSGMGRSIALTLAREGARVAVNYRSSEESARAIVGHVEAGGGEAVAVQADVFEASGCKKLVEAAAEAFGHVDICVIGPGAGWHMEPPGELDAEAALQDARQELAPIYHLMPLLLPGMCKRKWGRLIAISLEGPPEQSPSYAYDVAKAARDAAIVRARGEAWPHGVTLNLIGPGPVPAIETLEEAVEQCEHGAAWRKRTAASPQDVAEAVAFLCSEAGRFVTGCKIPFPER